MIVSGGISVDGVEPVANPLPRSNRHDPPTGHFAGGWLGTATAWRVPDRASIRTLVPNGCGCLHRLIGWPRPSFGPARR